VTDENDDQAEPSPRQRKIIHVVMDAFYASIEQRDDPDRPVSARSPSSANDAATLMKTLEVRRASLDESRHQSHAHRPYLDSRFSSSTSVSRERGESPHCQSTRFRSSFVAPGAKLRTIIAR
jgi:hypothetical protein